MSDLVTKLEIDYLKQMSYEEINDTLKKLKGKVDNLQQQLKQQWVSVDDAKKYEDCEVVYYCDFCGTKEVGFVMHGVVNRLGLVGDYIPVDDVNLLLPLPPTK
jgi:hypothetical protein